MEQFVESYDFTDAIELCDKSIRRTVVDLPLGLSSKLNVIEKLEHHFEDFRSRKMAFYLQEAMASLFEKQASFDSSAKLYDKLIAGYVKLFDGSTE